MYKTLSPRYSQTFLLTPKLCNTPWYELLILYRESGSPSSKYLYQRRHVKRMVSWEHLVYTMHNIEHICLWANRVTNLRPKRSRGTSEVKCFVWMTTADEDWRDFTPSIKAAEDNSFGLKRLLWLLESKACLRFAALHPSLSCSCSRSSSFESRCWNTRVKSAPSLRVKLELSLRKEMILGIRLRDRAFLDAWMSRQFAAKFAM